MQLAQIYPWFCGFYFYYYEYFRNLAKHPPTFEKEILQLCFDMISGKLYLTTVLVLMACGDWVRIN